MQSTNDRKEEWRRCKRAWADKIALRREGEKRKVPIVITAFPRGGSHYMAALCQSMGLDVLPEAMGLDGTSDWRIAEKELQPKEMLLIHALREPCATISSFVHAPLNPQIIHDHVPDAGVLPCDIAATLFMGWHHYIESQSPAITVKVEEASMTLPGELRKAGIDVAPGEVLPPSNWNGGSPHPRWSWIELLGKMSRPVWERLRVWSRQHSYGDYA